MSDELRELSGMILREPTPWGASLSISEQYIDFDRMVGDAAFVDAEARAAEVEKRILAGEDDFTIGNIRYTVPIWREPIKRLRVEWARSKARR